MSEREKLKRFLRKEMRKIMSYHNRTLQGKKIDDLTFSFCWSQSTFDILMDIDRQLKLGAFYKLK